MKESDPRHSLSDVPSSAAHMKKMISYEDLQSFETFDHVSRRIANHSANIAIGDLICVETVYDGLNTLGRIGTLEEGNGAKMCIRVRHQ